MAEEKIRAGRWIVQEGEAYTLGHGGILSNIHPFARDVPRWIPSAVGAEPKLGAERIPSIRSGALQSHKPPSPYSQHNGAERGEQNSRKRLGNCPE